jgi:hypothetical protein
MPRKHGVEVQLHRSGPRHKMEVSGQLHAPAALPPGSLRRYQLDRRLGGSQSRSGLYGDKILPLSRFETRPSSQHPVAIATYIYKTHKDFVSIKKIG